MEGHTATILGCLHSGYRDLSNDTLVKSLLPPIRKPLICPSPALSSDRLRSQNEPHKRLGAKIMKIYTLSYSSLLEVYWHTQWTLSKVKLLGPLTFPYPRYETPKLLPEFHFSIFYMNNVTIFSCLFLCDP
ncbi:hypothetical protein ATANTOWER_014600 [Ataeniobius toweri]|uniref:Uncharacterized protein n=1 Tax=Ataeniobius toweri TaxID=208326 RepID=A0ABU7BGD1_9TELE|nr:hypothetical protein [Ataeniobius toweri]